MRDPGIEMVREFHEALGITDGPMPAPPLRVRQALAGYVRDAGRLAEGLRTASARAGGSPQLLRLQLIQSELAELAQAFLNSDMVETLDALVDIGYVVDGTYLATGLDAYKGAVMREVHRSNMTKAEAGREASGRVLKGSNYVPPDLSGVIEGRIK